MVGSIHTVERVPRLAAALAAAIIAISLVSAPVATNPRLVGTTQVHSLAVELTATSSGDAAATPGANASAPQTILTSAVMTAAVLALIPAWYVAIPVTLPASIAVSIIVVGLFSGFVSMGSRWDLNPGVALALGIGAWAAGPLYVGSQALTLLGKQLVPTAAPKPSSAAATTRASQSVPRNPRRVDNAGGAKASSARPAHRSTKSTAKSTTKKTHASTADSGRTVGKTS